MWELVVRRRPTVLEEIEGVHKKLLSALEQLPPPWRCAKPLPLKQKPGNLTTTVSFRGKLGKGISGYACYSLRSSEYLMESSQFDDHFTFEVDPSNVDLKETAAGVICTLVEALGAYRAAVTDRAVAARDWEAVVEESNRTGTDRDGRVGIYRLSPFAYYESRLIEQELQVSAARFAELAGDYVRVFYKGALVNCQDVELSNDGLAWIDKELRRVAIAS